MIKLTFCLRRLPELSYPAFRRYWLETHGPLVQSFQPALGFRRYAQIHSLTGPLAEAMAVSRGGPEPFDGVAELWWDDIEILERLSRDPDARAARAALVEDEKKFIDLPRSPLWLGEEYLFDEFPEAETSVH